MAKKRVVIMAMALFLTAVFHLSCDNDSPATCPSLPPSTALPTGVVSSVQLFALEHSSPAWPVGSEPLILTDTLRVKAPNDLTSATVRMTGGYHADQDVIALAAGAALPGGIQGSWDAATGTFTLAGSATPAAYQNALRALRYDNVGTSPNTNPRTIRFAVSDATGSSLPVLRKVALQSALPPTKVFNVADYGALGYVGDYHDAENHTDDGPAIQKALQAAVAAANAGERAEVAFVANRIYYVATMPDQSAVFQLDGARNVAFNGHGATIVHRYPLLGIRLNGCSNVTISGFKMKMTPYSLLSWDIVAMNQAQGTIDVKLQSQYPALPPLDTSPDSSDKYNLSWAGGNIFLPQSFMAIDAASTDNRTVRLTVQGGGDWIGGLTPGTDTVTGMWPDMKNFPSVSIYWSEYVTVEDYNMDSSALFLMMVMHNGPVTFRNFVGLPRPKSEGGHGSAISMRDLALNEGTRDPLFYEDCQFGGAWDDTFHVQGDMWQAGISRLVSPTEYELWPNGYDDHPTATPGDSVVIVNADTGIPLGHARVLSGDRLRMVVDRVVEIPNDASTPTSPVRVVIDDTDLGERFVVRRSLASTQVRPHGSFVMEGSTLGGYWPIAGTPFAFDNTFIGNQMDWFQAENHPAGSEFNWFFAGNTFRPSSNVYVPTLIAGPVRQAVFWDNDLPGAGHITFSGASLYLRDNTVKGETVADQANVTEPDNTLVIDGQGPIVASISLLNADTGNPIAGYDPIADSQVIALAALPTRHLKLRANVLYTATAVAFDVSTLMGGKITTGNAAEAFSIPWTADDVRHTVVATPRNGTAVGRSLRITFYPTDLMSSWQTGTLGSPCSLASGLAYQSGKYLVVSGSGDTGGQADQGARWAHTTMGSDGDVVVRVVSQTVTDVGAKAGVVLRKDTAADASYALLAVTPAQGLVFETRASPGAAATVVATGSFPTLPYWLKLSRAGESVSAFVSLDGTTWSSLGDEQKVQLSSSAQWGVVVSSHRIGEPSTARFDSVSPLVP